MALPLARKAFESLCPEPGSGAEEDKHITSSQGRLPPPIVCLVGHHSLEHWAMPFPGHLCLSSAGAAMEPDQPKGLGSCPSPCPGCLTVQCCGVLRCTWGLVGSSPHSVCPPALHPAHACMVLGLPESLGKGSWRHVGSVGFEHQGVQDRMLHWDLRWSHGSWRASGGAGTWELTAAHAPHMEWWLEDAAGSRYCCQAPLSTTGWW